MYFVFSHFLSVLMFFKKLLTNLINLSALFSIFFLLEETVKLFVSIVEKIKILKETK